MTLQDLIRHSPRWIPDGIPSQATAWSESRWKQYFELAPIEFSSLRPSGKPGAGSRWDKLPRVQQIRAWLFAPEERSPTWFWNLRDSAQVAWLVCALDNFDHVLESLKNQGWSSNGPNGVQASTGLPGLDAGVAALIDGSVLLHGLSPLWRVAGARLADFMQLLREQRIATLQDEEQAVCWMAMLALADLMRLPELALWSQSEPSFAKAFPSWKGLEELVAQYRKACPAHVQLLLQASAFVSSKVVFEVAAPPLKSGRVSLRMVTGEPLYHSEASLLNFTQKAAYLLYQASSGALSSVQTRQKDEIQAFLSENVLTLVQGRPPGHVLPVVRRVVDVLREDAQGFVQGRYALNDQASLWLDWAAQTVRAAKALHQGLDQLEGRVQELAKQPRENVERLHALTQELLTFSRQEHPKAQELELALLERPAPVLAQRSSEEVEGAKPLLEGAAQADAQDLAQAEALRQALDTVQAQKTQLEGKLREAGARIAALSEECSGLRNEQALGVFEPTKDLLQRLPKMGWSTLDVLMLAVSARPALVLTSSAVDSARKAHLFRRTDRLLELLLLLGGEYAQALAQGKPDAQARAILGQAYRAGESDTTLASKTLREARTFAVDGENVLMDAHLAIGAAHNVAETLRVHFVWRGGKIVIGYAGEHLPVSGV